MTPTRRERAGIGGRVMLRTQPMFHRVITAQPRTVRETLSDIRQRFGGEVGTDTLGRLELVLAEVLNNVAEHAGEGGESSNVHLCIVRHETGLSCAITDDGVSLPDECLLPRSLPQERGEELPEGGFGWYLI